jgi:hypothetical protein
VFRREKLRPEQLLDRVPLLGSEELCGIGGTSRKIRKRGWRTPYSGEQSKPLTSKDTLQKKGLTSRYLPRLMDLFTSTPGLDPRLFGFMESLGELGRLV